VPTSRIPVPTSSSPVLRRSARIAALRTPTLEPSAAHMATDEYDASDHSEAFLAEFAPLRDTHFLLPIELDLSQSCSTVGEALTAMAVGATDLVLDPDDDPNWANAIASPEREYWVAGARDELRSYGLESLRVGTALRDPAWPATSKREARLQAEAG